MMNPFMRPPFGAGPPRPPFRGPSMMRGPAGPGGPHMMGPPRGPYMGPGPMRPQIGMQMQGPGPIPVQMNQPPRVPIQAPKPASVD